MLLETAHTTHAHRPSNPVSVVPLRHLVNRIKSHHLFACIHWTWTVDIQSVINLDLWVWPFFWSK